MGTNVQDVAARAKQLISERKYQEAVRACRRVLLSRPNEVSVRLLLAQALLALNRHDEVRIEMQALTRKQPDIAAAHRLLAEAYMRSGQKDAAESSLKRALQLDAEDEDASDLMDELDEVEQAPPPETIDRWFTNEPETVETPMAPPSTEVTSPPATEPASDQGPTVQLDPDFEREASKEHEPRRERKPKRTMMGMGAIAAPPAAAPPKPKIPSAPPPAKLPPKSLPPPSGEIAGAPTRAKRPKRTMLGMPAALPTPSPTALTDEDSASIEPPLDTGTDELDSEALELVAEDVLKKDTTTELQAEDLAGGIIDASTETLSTQEISLIQSGTDELSAADIALGEVDPYEELAEGLPPLAGEATEARSAEFDSEFTDEKTRQAKGASAPPPAAVPPIAPPPGQPSPFEPYPDELEGEPTRARPPAAIADPDSFDDMPTMARDRTDMGFDDDTHGARPSKMKEPEPDSDSLEDLATTTARPIVAEFPEDMVDGGGLPPLPPLEGEATVARDVRAPRAGEQVGRPSTGKVPAGFAPAPGPGPAGAQAQAPRQPPKKKRKKTLANRIAEVREKVPVIDRVGELPLGGRIALAGIPVLIVAALIAVVKIWSSSQAETAIQTAVDQASRDGLVASVEAANELDAEENDDTPMAIARRARLYAMAVLEHGYESEESQNTARQLAAGLLAQLEGVENPNQADQVAAQIYLALEAGDVERANILADRVEPNVPELKYAKALVYYTQGELAEAAQLLTSIETAPRYTGLLARILAEQGQVDEAASLLDPFPEASPVRALALAQVKRFGSDSAFLATTTALMDTELLSSASPHQRAWALLLNAEARARDGQRDAIEVAASAEATHPRGDERFVLRLATLYRKLSAHDRAANALRLLPEKPARPEARVLVQAEVQLAVRDLAEVSRILEGASESPQTQYLRGRLAEEQGRRDEAEAFYTTAAEDADRFIPAKTRLGAMALAAGNPETAIAHLEAAAERAPTELEVVSLLAEAYVAKPDLDAAVTLLQEAQSRGLDSPRLLVVRARVDLARGEAQAALTTLNSLENQFGSDPEFLATLGEAARRAGDAARAGQAFERALGVDPRNRMALTGTAEIALDATDVEGANGAVARAREAGIEGGTLRLLEGRLLVLQGAGIEAARKLRPLAGRTRRRRFRLTSTNPVVLTAYGVALAQAESDRNARTALSRAIRLDENQIDAQLALAAVHTRQGDLNEASEAAAAAQQIVDRRSLGPRYEARVIAARGRILYENNRLDQARRLADEAIAKDSRCTSAHLLVALLADARGQSPIPALRRALEGRNPIPEVLGQLTLLDRSNPDRCDYARRYLEAAPSGIDAADAQAVRRRCS